MARGKPIPVNLVQDATDPLVAEIFALLDDRAKLLGKPPGSIGNIHRAMANSPKLFGVLVAMADTLRRDTDLDPLEKELATLCALHMHGGEYEIGPHSHYARSLGATDEQIAHVTDPDRADVFTPRQRAIIRFARRLAAMPADEPGDEDDAIREHLDDRQLIELSFALSFYIGLAHVTGVLDIR